MPIRESKPFPEFTQKDKDRFWSKVDRSGGPEACWPYLISKRRRYGQFTVGRGNYYSAHRVAYFLGMGVDPGDRLVCHDCPKGDMMKCCNFNHMWLGTNEQNQVDKGLKGRANIGKGDAAPNHKLTAAQVLEIRRLYVSGGVSLRQLGIRFSVCTVTILNVVRKRTYLDCI